MYQEYLNFAKDIALYAGKVMMDYYQKDITLNYKEDRTPVTEVDKKINHYLIEQVSSKYPDHSVLGEEEWYFESHTINDLTASYEPCVSFGAIDTYEVSIIDTEFLTQIYRYFLENAHMDIMKNFAFDLDRMRNNRILPYSNEKLITTDNMNWKVSEYFALLPESIVSPIEIEKWNGTIHFEKPNYDPDAPIQQIE